MPFPTEITVAQLSRIIGLPDAPPLIDVRAEEEFRADPRVIPTARRHDYREKSGWAKHYLHQSVIVYCQRGLTLSQGTAAWLRDQHIHAQTLMGGYLDWISSHQPLVCSEKTPARDELGRTVWVTRARPKVVRIACPWLIRRFIDPKAVFLFVAPSEVTGVADRFGATPFDVDGVFWSDRSDKCTFDVMIEEFGLKSQPLNHLALIVRGADTDRLDLTPQSGGLLAARWAFHACTEMTSLSLRLPWRSTTPTTVGAATRPTRRTTDLRIARRDPRYSRNHRHQGSRIMFGIVPFDLTIFVLGTLAASFVTGAAGFAFGLVAAAIWLYALPPSQTTVLIVTYGLLVQAYAVWKLRHNLNVDRLMPLIVGSAIGVPFGILVLRWVPPGYLRTAIGAVLILFSLYNLVRPTLSSMKQVGRLGDASAGFLNGLVGGSTGLAGVVIVIWSSLRGWQKDEQRAAFQPTGVATFLMTLIALGGVGGINSAVIKLFAIGLPFLAIGTWVGWTVYGKLDEARFRKGVLVLLLVSGAALAV